MHAYKCIFVCGCGHAYVCMYVCVQVCMSVSDIEHTNYSDF